MQRELQLVPEKPNVKLNRFLANLTEIERMCEGLEEAAEAEAAKGRPVSENRALLMMGPVASLEAWEHRYEAAAARAGDRFSDYADDQDDVHPLTVLAGWTEIFRRELNVESDLEPTISRCTAFLRTYAWDLYQDGGQYEAECKAMSREVSAVRGLLEDVLRDGTRPVRSRVHCTHPDCPTSPRLVLEMGSVPAFDRYVCTDSECLARYSTNGFEQATQENLYSGMAEELVRMTDAIAALGLNKNTAMSWARRGDVQTTTCIKTGKMLVWWPDIRDRAAGLADIKLWEAA